MCKGEKDKCELCVPQGLIGVEKVIVLPSGKLPEIRRGGDKKQELVIVVGTG